MNSIATSARWACRASGPHRRAFTLTELLFVMMILAILAALSLSALSGATQQARIERTRAIINRLDKLIIEKYNSYRTRAVPIRVAPGTDPRTASAYRLRALRELMRMEMPNHRFDLLIGVDNFTPPLNNNSFANVRVTQPAAWKSYRRKVLGLTNNNFNNWTAEHEGAECLYLIISSMRDGEDSALDFFAPSEIGDTDNDNVPEILDAFGMPINYIRWPFGYSEHPGPDGAWGVQNNDDDNDTIVDNYTEAGAGDDLPPPPTSQTRNAKKAPDPFDPLRVDTRWTDPDVTFDPIEVRPLIYSAGSDRVYAIKRETRDISSLPNPWTALNDPFTLDTATSPGAAGTPFDSSGDAGFADNITNHDFSEK
jgi:prepilin-type N-terminal cleavage/methylation domain-containing protein